MSTPWQRMFGGGEDLNRVQRRSQDRDWKRMQRRNLRAHRRRQRESDERD